MGTVRETFTSVQKSKALSLAREKYLAMLMLDGANKEHSAKLKVGMDLDVQKARTHVY